MSAHCQTELSLLFKGITVTFDMNLYAPISHAVTRLTAQQNCFLLAICVPPKKKQYCGFVSFKKSARLRLRNARVYFMKSNLAFFHSARFTFTRHICKKLEFAQRSSHLTNLRTLRNSLMDAQCESELSKCLILIWGHF